MEFDGFYVWFWSRSDVPESLQNATSTSIMDTSTWGTPTAAYPNTACDLVKYFPPQNLVLLTTLCGVWAGVPSIYTSRCHTPTGSCYNNNVVGSGSNFADAYWEIRYIRTYISDAIAVTTTSSDVSTSTAASNDPINSLGTDVKTTSSASTVASRPAWRAGICSALPMIFVMTLLS